MASWNSGCPVVFRVQRVLALPSGASSGAHPFCNGCPVVSPPATFLFPSGKANRPDSCPAVELALRRAITGPKTWRIMGDGILEFRVSSGL